MDVKSVAAVAMAVPLADPRGDGVRLVPPAVLEPAAPGGFTVQLPGSLGPRSRRTARATRSRYGRAGQAPRQSPQREALWPNWRSTSTTPRPALGVSVADINDTLSTAWGAPRGETTLHRPWPHQESSRPPPTRLDTGDLDKWCVRNARARWIPLLGLRERPLTYGLAASQAFNGQPSMERYSARRHRASRPGEAMKAVEEIAAKLQAGIGYDWSGTSYEGAKAPRRRRCSHRRFSSSSCVSRRSARAGPVPFAVMLVVPLGVLGAIVAATGRGLSNDIYFG